MSFKPREDDSKMSLRVWFLLLCASNIPSFWSHAKDGASEGRAIILDFVGMGMRWCFYIFAFQLNSFVYYRISTVQVTSTAPGHIHRIPPNGPHDNLL